MSPVMLVDELAALDPEARRELATTLRQVSETFAEVADGKTTSHVLGVLARLLDPALTCTENGLERDGLLRVGRPGSRRPRDQARRRSPTGLVNPSHKAVILKT